MPKIACMKCCFINKKDVFCTAAGASAGLVNGLLGAGGGMLLVPMFIGLCKIEKKKALATSVAVIMPLCAVSAAVYFISGSPFPKMLPYYALGGLAGGFAGGILLKKLPPLFLIRAFGALMVFAGFRMLFW
jgi:uncharacterized membrane protein YfcA